MKNKVYILLILILLAALFAAPAMATDSQQDREYQVKAAFIYNFIKFIEWPKEPSAEKPKQKAADAGKTITIVIVGEHQFDKAFDPIIKKKIRGSKLIVKQVPGPEQFKQKAGNKNRYLAEYREKYGKTLKKCEVLFICSSEKRHVKELVSITKDNSTLTVSEMDGFLASGGIINFVTEKSKVRFEINLAAAQKKKLKISSQLLRLAKKVIKNKKAYKNGAAGGKPAGK